jgi:alkanesulfonate monooxygenase SsuD/methylene tetrahydromethanopterin reductase-like flavin-dependent oxidoreductase (luciferase family)
MKFGVLVNRAMLDRNAGDPYGKLYAYLNEMQDLGYDIAYVGQHRFSPKTAFGGSQATAPSAPLTMIAALLARTSRIKLCTNIMLLAAHHPLEVAEQINTLNELSNNRFILGAAIGYVPHEFESVGWSFRTRAKRFEECIEILRLALTGEQFSFSGKHFTIPPCTLQPPPLPGAEMPIWIGAVSEPAMQRAGRMGDGWLIGFAENLVELRDKVARYKAIAAQYGRPSTLCLMRDLHIAPSRRQLDADWLRKVATVWQAYAGAGAEPDRDETSKAVMLGGKEITLEQFAPDRAIVGDPEDCIREMHRVKELINPEYVLLTPTDVPDPDQQIRELWLFAKEVMPLFNGSKDQNELQRGRLIS